MIDIPDKLKEFYRLKSLGVETIILNGHKDPIAILCALIGCEVIMTKEGHYECL